MLQELHFFQRTHLQGCIPSRPGIFIFLEDVFPGTFEQYPIQIVLLFDGLIEPIVLLEVGFLQNGLEDEIVGRWLVRDRVLLLMDFIILLSPFDPPGSEGFVFGVGEGAPGGQ